MHDRLLNPLGVKRGAPEARTVRDLIAEYGKDREARHGKESTHRKCGLLFRAMKEVWGEDLPVQAISRRHCIELLSLLKRAPPNVGKRFPRLSLARAVAKAEAEGLPGLAPNTVGSYMQGDVAMLRWAADEDWGVKVNTRDLVETRRAQVKRRGFKVDELHKLFGALRAFRETEPTKYWVPALALFTGASAGEICQLRSEDVVEVGGVYCLNLSEFDARGVRVDVQQVALLTLPAISVALWDTYQCPDRWTAPSLEGGPLRLPGRAARGAAGSVQSMTPPPNAASQKGPRDQRSRPPAFVRLKTNPARRGSRFRQRRVGPPGRSAML